MSKESFYFSHDYNSRTDDKVKKLIRFYGMEGYGIFWAIVENLYNNANALQLDYEGIAYELRVEPEMVKHIVNDYDLFIIENESFGSTSVERRLDERNEKSEKARQSAFKRWNKIKPNADAMPTHNEGNAIKDIKERKKKDIKDNIVSAKKAEMDFIDKIIQLFVEAHGDYLIVNNGEERKAAAKILGIYKKKYPGATSEETLAALKQYFLNCVNIPDAWLKTNMSLPIIINKFNQISKILKNGTAKKPGATYTDLARITLKNFPEQFNKD